MKIQNITDQQQWDGWLKTNSQHNSFTPHQKQGNFGAGFTQSWAWGDILLAEGPTVASGYGGQRKKVERLAVVEGDEVLAEAQIVYSRIFFGWQYVFCPQGPMIGNYEIKKLKEIYDVFIDYFKKKKAVFLRVEPQSSNFPISQFLNFKKTIDINPPATLILNLEKTEEELLAGMHQKTRYNIHLAEKKDLKINNEKNPAVFWNLMNQTGNRDKFSLHHKSHYEKVLASPMVFQLTAYESEKAVAVAVFAHFGNTFTYLYGASDYAHRDLMAPYLLQWGGVKMGKSLGCAYYDFFGVAPRLQLGPSAVIPAASGNPDNSNVPWIYPSGHPRPNQVGNDNYKYDPKHQYAGVTRFKLGFGGVPQQSAGTFDVMINKNKYYFYSFLRWLRRLL